MRSKPEITDTQIHEFMDFERLLLDRKTSIQARNLRLLKMAIFAGGVIATALITFFLLSEDSFTRVRQEDPVITPQAPGPSLLKPDSARQLIDNHEVVMEPQPPVRQQSRSSQTKPIVPSLQKKEIAKEPVYVQSEPVDGFPHLYQYFSEQLKYPPALLNDSIQGVTTVVFTIDVNGRPRDIHIENSLGAAFDEEVLRVIGNMPLWKPATYNGTPVNSKVSVPLTFSVKKQSEN